MNFNFFKNLYRKIYKENKEVDEELVDSNKNSNKVYTNINIEHNENLIKIEIKKDCSLQEYSNEIDRILQENLSDMDNNMIDMINKLPIRMLISNGLKTIDGQTIYLIRNDDYQYIISSNAENIYVSERRTVDTEIEESTIKICFQNRDYQISKYIHDINRSTKSVKSYKTDRVSSNNFFCMDKETAVSTVKTVLQHLEENEIIKDILDLEYISSFLRSIEGTDVIKIEDNMKDSDEKNNEQIEY